MRRWGLIALLAGLTTCSLPTGLYDVEYKIHGQWPLDPVPAWYETVWNDTRECVRIGLANGIGGRITGIQFRDVSWFLTDNITASDGSLPAAISEIQNRRTTFIYPYAEIPWVVAHESLHYMTWPQTHGQGLFAACDPQPT